MGRFVCAGSIWVVPVTVLVALSAACASNQTPLDKELATLRDQITRLENGTDRLEERLAALELAPKAQAKHEPDEPVVEPSSVRGELVRPELEVVKLDPNLANPSPVSEAPSDEPEHGDTGRRRPLISGQGQRIRSDYAEKPSAAEAAVKKPRKR
jgi:hypothetical protein